MTTDRVFVDTNVFVYARDDRYPAKKTAAGQRLARLAAREMLVASPQVIGEFHHVALRGKLPVAPGDARQATLDLDPFSHGAVDLELIYGAWSIREETAFQWWDCVILGSAIRAGCRYLLSEVYQHGRAIRGTTILNPFAVGPDAVDVEH